MHIIHRPKNQIKYYTKDAKHATWPQSVSQSVSRPVRCLAINFTTCEVEDQRRKIENIEFGFINPFVSALVYGIFSYNSRYCFHYIVYFFDARVVVFIYWLLFYISSFCKYSAYFIRTDVALTVGILLLPPLALSKRRWVGVVGATVTRLGLVPSICRRFTPASHAFLRVRIFYCCVRLWLTDIIKK